MKVLKEYIPFSSDVHRLIWILDAMDRLAGERGQNWMGMAASESQPVGGLLAYIEWVPHTAF